MYRVDNRCQRCTKPVYYAEQIIAVGRHWHKSCFLCANPECHRRLDSQSCTDHDGEAYCQHCYKKLFGPKGYGFGVGAGTLSMEGSGNEHERSSIAANHSPNNNNHSHHHQQQSPPSRRLLLSSPSQLSRSVGAAAERNDICPRCGLCVYEAEKMVAAGAVWHKSGCFTCIECSRRLQSTTLCERNQQIYCKTCYSRLFGPKGYGYGIGAGTLQME